MYEIDNKILDEMAKNNLTYERGKKVLFSKVQNHELLEEVIPNLYVYSAFSRNAIFEWIRDLFNRYQIDIQNFCILYVEKDYNRPILGLFLFKKR